MNVLSTSLQEKIKSRPTNTIPRSKQSVKDRNLHAQRLKSIDILDKKIKLPIQFDGRKVWEGLLTTPENQGTCGSCWAFASVGTLADKFNIQSMGLMNITLSVAKLILCDFNDADAYIKHGEKNWLEVGIQESKSNKTTACFGNSLADAWRYLFIYGTNTEDCVPYNKKYGKFKELDGLGSFTNPQKMPICSQVTGPIKDMCANFTYDMYNSDETGTPARFFRNIHYYALAGVSADGGSQKNLMYNLFRWGPLSTTFIVYPDFYEFDAKNKIYEWNGEGPQVGGHAVEIIGWGTKNNIDYWDIKNSWGTDWGDGGYFRMIRGTNNCELEENVITGIPDFFYPLDHPRLADTTGLIWAESAKSVEERRSINTNMYQQGGGIDPSTGYSRRVMATMPWTDLSRPVPLNKLPNYTNWVAGIDASINNRTPYQSSKKEKNLKYSNQSIYTIISLITILVIILIIIGIIYLVNRKNHM
jgi:hypothetical protein